MDQNCVLPATKEHYLYQRLSYPYNIHLELLSHAEKRKIRQEKQCQQGLDFHGPHYTGGLSVRIVLIHPQLKSFSTATRVVLWAFSSPIFFFFFLC